MWNVWKAHINEGTALQSANAITDLNVLDSQTLIKCVLCADLCAGRSQWIIRLGRPGPYAQWTHHQVGKPIPAHLGKYSWETHRSESKNSQEWLTNSMWGQQKWVTPCPYNKLQSLHHGWWTLPKRVQVDQLAWPPLVVLPLNLYATSHSLGSAVMSWIVPPSKIYWSPNSYYLCWVWAYLEIGS